MTNRCPNCGSDDLVTEKWPLLRCMACLTPVDDRDFALKYFRGRYDPRKVTQPLHA